MKLQIALAGLALASCRALPSGPPATSPQAEIEYSIELVRNPALGLRLAVSAPAAADGVTTFSIDESWGGVDDAALLVLDLRVTRPSGDVLAIERPSPHEWRVHGTPGERLTASWRLAPNAYQADSDPRAHYHPILNEHLLHLIGNLGLVYPEHLAGPQRHQIALRWKGFAEAGWTVACSFSLDPRGFETAASLDELRHAVYLAGDLRVQEVEVRGRQVAVAIAGSQWNFRDDDLAGDVRAIVEAERTFFDDDDFPFFLVSLIPVGQADSHSRSLGGTGLTQSFALFLQPDTPLGSRSGGDLGVQHLLAHEMFHHWNGRILTLEEPEELAYWFSEGFTDFYARVLLCRAGYGGTTELARSLDETLRAYGTSPAREVANERIREAFWKDRDVGRIPYLRGDLVAVLLDREIRERSGEGRSLDDFMRDAVERGRRGERVGTEVLLRRIEEWTDRAFADRVRAIVVEGATVEVEPSTFEPCLEVTTESLGPWDLGFDFEASRAANEARGVRPGSAAEQAGLADGQSIVGWSVSFGQPDVPVELVVREGGEERTIRWRPQGEPRPVQRVRVRSGAQEKDCPWR